MGVVTSGARAPLAAVLLLWLAAAAIVAVGAISDRAARQAGPEEAVSAYFQAVENGNLEAALAQLVPGARQPASSWVEWQLGNRYHIIESVVRTRPLLSSLFNQGTSGTSTVVVEVDVSGKGNPTWRAVEEVPAVQDGGQWLLTKPPLEGR